MCDNFVCLFSIPVPAGVSPSSEMPPGLILLPDFISEETEKALMNMVDFEAVASPGTGVYCNISFLLP